MAGKRKEEKKEKRERISPSFDIETYKKIEHYAHCNGKSMSEQVRDWAIEGLNVEVNKENLDLITKIIREQLRDVLQPSVERLATLSAKTCVQASTAAYLTAEAINKFVPIELQEEVMDTYEQARKKGIAYTKGRVDIDE